MIISHKHKFIFIKTQKTAGTSIEAFLSSYCEGSDVVTFLGMEDELIRRKMGVFPMNNLRPEYEIPDEKDAKIESPKDLKKFRKQHKYHLFAKNYEKRRVLFGPHASAARVRKKIEKGLWDDYYTFCFDRDPWERTISFFYFSPKHRSIKFATDEQVRNYVTGNQAQGKYSCNSKFYTSEHGKLLVKDLFNFSDLDGAMRSICTRLGFDFEKFKSLPKFKGDHRKDRRPYEEFLSNETIELIGTINERAIDLLGFKPRASKLEGGSPAVKVG